MAIPAIPATFEQVASAPPVSTERFASAGVCPIATSTFFAPYFKGISARGAASPRGEINGFCSTMPTPQIAVAVVTASPTSPGPIRTVSSEWVFGAVSVFTESPTSPAPALLASREGTFGEITIPEEAGGWSAQAVSASTAAKSAGSLQGLGMDFPVLHFPFSLITRRSGTAQFSAAPEKLTNVENPVPQRQKVSRTANRRGSTFSCARIVPASRSDMTASGSAANSPRRFRIGLSSS